MAIAQRKGRHTMQAAQHRAELTAEQVAFFEENGFLRLEGVFSPEEVAELSEELDYVIEQFCIPGKGWTGPWREKYLTQMEDEKATLTATHEMQLYSAAWARAILNRRLVRAVADLIGPEVEFHHMTLHAKGPEFGTPFPLHQDNPFYEHSNGQYVDAIVHVDAGTEENGCLKFLPGSHKLGALEHVREGSPHLPPEAYPFEKAVSCPAAAGDVVLFSIYTIHGSALNRTPQWRRFVRIGYRNPRNLQVAGQALGRPGWMVHGVRPKIEGVEIVPYGPMKVNQAKAG
ncbi:MAG TPA: phytanoyl-CoA dioxygenase family protein [Limnochordia bacterium]